MRRLKGTVTSGGEGSIEGMAAATGNLDRHRDVLAPGCFAGCVEKFASEGLLMQFHRWDQQAIGTVTAASEVPGGLAFRGEFFDDDESQRVRKYCATLQARGRKVGVSIGFAVDEASVSYHRTGAELAKAAQKDGIAVDSEIASFRGGCVLVRKVTEVYEASIVTVPANSLAFADTVKQFLGGDGAYAGLTLDAHLATALSAVQGALARVEAVKAARDAEGRALSLARLDELDEIARTLARLKDAREAPDARHVARAVIEAELALAGTDI